MNRVLAGLRRYRWWLAGIGGPIVLVAAVLIALPYVARAELAAWLRQDGVREASIERVAIHYLDSQVEIFGLQSKDKDGKALRFDRIALAVDLPALFDRRAHVRALAFEGGAIELTQSRDGAVSLAGIPMDSGPPAAEPPPADSKPWLIGIDSTRIGSLAIRLHAPDGTQDFTVENARLGTFAMWAGEATTALQLAAAIGEGNLAVSGEATPLGASPSAAVDLDVQSFDLTQLRFLHGMEGLKGVLGGHLKIRAELGREGAATIHLAGDATLNGFALPEAASIGAVSWTGDAEVATKNDGGLTARIKGRLAIEAVAADKNTLASATIENLDLNARRDPATGLDADVSGNFDLVRAGLDLGDTKGGAGRLRWNGKLHIAQSAGGGERIEAKGDLAIEAPRYATPGAEATLARVGYDKLDAKLARASSGALDAQAAGALSADEVRARLGDDTIRNGSLGWTGTVSVAAEPGKDPEVALDGALDSRETAADLKSVGYAASQREAHWEGTAKLGADGAVTMTGSARTAGTAVDMPAQKLRLVEVGQLALGEATLAANGRLGAKTVQIDTLRAFGPPDAKDASGYVAAIRALTADELGYEPDERISAKGVKIDDAEVELERDDKGKLRLTGFLAALGGDKADESASAGGKTPRIELGALTLGGKSRIQFTDRSVDPPAKIALTPITLRLGALDTTAPDRPVPIEFAANIGRYAELNLKGSAKPFTERVNVDMQGKLSGFELTSLSGYLSQFLGYDLSRGRLDSDLHIKIVDGALDTGSQLTITNLVVAQGQSSASRALQKNLEIPVETALSLLRDSDDVIQLNVPIKGDIASPDFDLSDAINTAIGNAMKRTVMTLIFPLGGLIAIAESGDAGLRFKPIAFAGGEVEIDADARQSLDGIAKLLAERKGVRITACGVSTQKDAEDILHVRQQKAMIEAAKTSRPPEESAPVTRDELYDLSQRRSEAVKDYLIGRPGVTESRVFTCAPNIADDAGAQPHADITL